MPPGQRARTAGLIFRRRQLAEQPDQLSSLGTRQDLQKVVVARMQDVGGCGATPFPLRSEGQPVVHAAQLTITGRVTRAKSDAIFEADALMTGALAQASPRHRKRLVYTGGCFDWGDRGDEWINEKTALAPSPMGVGHARQAALLQRLHEEQGLDVVRLNPVFVYGAGGLLRTAFVDQARRGRLRCIGSGQNWWSCVHVDDLGTAFALAVRHAKPGAYYAVADSEPIRLRALTDAVTDAMGLQRVGQGPPWLVGLFIGGPLVASLVTSFRVDASAIRKDLGWQPTHASFASGADAAVHALTAEQR
jgi:nucleoside-diphosphate-sugar epimerase